MARERLRPIVAFVALLGAAASCTPEPKTDDAKKGPIAAPRAQLSARHQLGGPLRGPRAPGVALAPEVSPSRALALEASVVALAAPPAWNVMLVTSQTRIVVAEGVAGGALRASPRTLSEARAGVLPDTLSRVVETAVVDSQARGRRLGSVRACLLPGTTTVFELGRDEPPGPTGEVRHLRAQVLVGRHGTGPELDFAVEVAAGEDPPELVELATPVLWKGAATTWVAVLPSPFGAEDEARFLAFVVELAPAPVEPAPGAAAHGEVVAGAVRELVAQAETARLAVAPLPPPPDVPDIEATRRSLTDRALARRGLYSLGRATGAHTAETVAIATDEHTLAPIASAVAAALGQATSKTKAAEVGIVVELATIAACRQALLTEPVPEDLPDALEWRGGAALRLISTVGTELDRAKTLDELECLLVTLNVRLLLDASPMIRARAAHWLGGRLSLEGYSPTAPSAERRAAVEKIKKRLAEASRGQR